MTGAAPDVLGERYRLLELLGRGGMGEVWLGDDQLLGRRVAIKKLSARALAEDDLRRVVREARTAAQLNHPHAVAVHDLVMHAGRPYVVFEYVRGRTLADRLDHEPGGLEPAAVARLGAAIARALADAHDHGVVHRDVKPANILVDERGTPKLADFGIARASSEARLTASGLLVGTPAYVAPEAATGAPASPASDVWSLGMTLYAALEGRPAFDADNVLTVLHHVVTRPVPPPTRGGAVADVVMTMLDRDPSRRPTAAGAAELLDAAAAAPLGDTGGGAADRWPTTAPLVGAQPTQPLPPAGGRPRATARRGRFVVAAAAVVVLGATAGVVLTLVPHDGPAARPPAGPSSSGPSRGSSSAALAEYSGPGGITCAFPSGWTQDDAAGIDNVRDYVEPGGSIRDNDGYIRLGVGRATAKPTITDEELDTLDYLRAPSNPYRGVHVVGTQTGVDFVGHPAVDIEFTGDNADGVQRHVVERLVIVGGRTLLVELNLRATEWPAQHGLFDRLVADCRLA
ncbi:MAG: serine/threonine-protein kinase [Jatrophihabitans sp.]|uniref:serine/threonine-protein kinase n=1 Tax=Jatrophihabitans sp. TaxID=1932789 RepID=UPI003F816406